MQKITKFFGSRTGIVTAGLAIGFIAALLERLGNPGNMGVCVACFERDITGALGLHRAGVVQYLRPEIPAFVLGSLVAAFAFGEFRPRTGSSPVVRFLLGIFAMMGALVFLGCPWRAILRLAGGDLNAALGLLGLAAGIGIGIIFLRTGFSLGRNYPSRNVTGLVLPVLMLGLLVFAVWYPSPPLFRSAKGPGSMSAAVGLSILFGLIIGFLAQRTRFCTVGGVRDVMLMGDTHLISGVGAFFIAALVANYALGHFGKFSWGFAGQPAAHNVHYLNFLGMVLAGLCFTLAGGCPGRQLFLSGEGDGDSAVFVMGMFAGAPLAHNLGVVGKSPNAIWVVVVGLAVTGLIGITSRDRH